MTKKFVASEDAVGRSLVANRPAQREWELFRVFHNDDGTYSLSSMANNKFVSVHLEKGAQLIASSTEIGQNEKFSVEQNQPNSFVLKAMANGKFVRVPQNFGYITSTQYNDNILVADSDEPKSWEQFEMIL
jgi:endoglucanase